MNRLNRIKKLEENFDQLLYANVKESLITIKENIKKGGIYE